MTTPLDLTALQTAVDEARYEHRTDVVVDVDSLQVLLDQIHGLHEDWQRLYQRIDVGAGFFGDYDRDVVLAIMREIRSSSDAATARAALAKVLAEVKHS